ncbi:MAG TPA: hypothetical protein VEX39_06645 [Thermoleophilaceae bacterium]|nr:hypothetical protein [Thermoleophilaceae bacterium]
MTSTAATIDDLRVEHAQAREQRDEAKRALGAAALDGTDQRPSSKQIDRATADLRRLEGAIAELERRQAAADEAAEIVAAARARARAYSWIAIYLERAEAAIRTHEAAAAAIEQLADLVPQQPRRLHALQAGLAVEWCPGTRVQRFEGRRPLQQDECDIDAELVNITQKRFAAPKLGRQSSYLPFPTLTVERCQQLRARAEELAAAETEAADAAEAEQEGRS